MRLPIHINISFDTDLTEFRLSDVNILKLIMRTDEDAIYSTFPSRQNNIYAKSVKDLANKYRKQLTICQKNLDKNKYFIF